MAFLFLLAFVVAELCPHLQSTRMHRGIAHAVPAFGVAKDGDMTAAAYDEKLLACKHVWTDSHETRFITQHKAKPFVEFVEYSYAMNRAEMNHGMRFVEFDYVMHPLASRPSLICKNFTLPPAPSSTLRNLTTHTLPEDVIGVISASFNDGVHCNECLLFSFNMTFLERCKTALTQDEWEKVNIEVEEEGGSCEFSVTREEQALQTCMMSPTANQVAVCHLHSAGYDSQFIKWKKNRIKGMEDQIEEHQRAIKKSAQKHQVFIEKRQEEMKVFQDALDMCRQNFLYLERDIKENKDAIEAHQATKQQRRESENNQEEQEFIKMRQDDIKDSQDTLDMRKKTVARTEEFIKDEEYAIEVHQRATEKKVHASQEFIKKRREDIRDLQDALDRHRQNVGYLKQMFEDP